MDTHLQSCGICHKLTKIKVINQAKVLSVNVELQWFLEKKKVSGTVSITIITAARQIFASNANLRTQRKIQLILMSLSRFRKRV